MNELVKQTEQFVLTHLKRHLDTRFTYHNYSHTRRVFERTVEIIENTELTEDDVIVLQLAALLHDTGFTETVAGHEEASAKIARTWLESKATDENIISKVETCIIATKLANQPNNELEEIIRDADCSHFARDYFEDTSELLRQELRLLGIKDYSPAEWRDENVKILMETHRFYSDHAIRNWLPRKEKNIAKLLRSKRSDSKSYDKEAFKQKVKVEAKEESPERGVQTFYRTTLKNHITLSDIADTKANILLSVNAIIISVVLANLLSKLDTNEFLVWPTGVFVLSSTITMILAVVATRPNITTGKFTMEDVKAKRVNLAFFGNFHKMTLQDFEWAVDQMIHDKEYLYSSLSKDLFFLGKVLNRKYGILRHTYTVFVVGIIVSVLTFGISFYFYEGGNPEIPVILNP
ncbi:MAG: Pycsar system effector family protein [Nonlabens sp.]